MRAFVRRLSNHVLMSADMIRFIFSQFAIGCGADMTCNEGVTSPIPKNIKGHSSQNTILPLFLSAGNRVENKLAKLHAVMTQSSMLSTWWRQRLSSTQLIHQIKRLVFILNKHYLIDLIHDTDIFI